MSSPAQRSSDHWTNEILWLEMPDGTHTSPVSIWVLEDDDEEITIQTKRARESEFEPVPPNVLNESTHEKAPRELLILDESQVLPGEASFATVKLNQEIENATIKRRERITASSVVEASVKDHSPRVRLLDESRVLPGEASFATIIVDGPLGKPAHSPIAEFLLRTNFSRQQLRVASLILFSTVALAAIVLLKVAASSNVLISPPSAGPVSNLSPVATQAAKDQTAPLNDSKSASPEAVSIPKNTVISVQASGRINGLNEPGAEAATGTINSEELRLRSTSSRAELKKPEDVKSVPYSASAKRNVGASEPLKTLKPSKAVIDKKPVELKKSESKESIEVRTKTESLPTVAEKPKEQAVMPPATGGGERPRRVTP